MAKRITAQELSSQINFLQRELFNAKVHYDIFKGLMDDWSKHLPAIHHSPLFWNTTIEAHVGAALIRLCRAYDKDDSSIHLSRFLRAVEANPDLFSEASFRERHKANPHVDSLAKHPRTLGLAQLQRDMDFCDAEQNPIVENLRKWRNFILAHSNYREAVQPVSDFHTRYPLPFSDIETLVMEGLGIVNRYSDLLDARVTARKSHRTTAKIINLFLLPSPRLYLKNPTRSLGASTEVVLTCKRSAWPSDVFTMATPHEPGYYASNMRPNRRRAMSHSILTFIAAFSLVSCATHDQALGGGRAQPATITVRNSRVNPNEMFGLQIFRAGDREFSQIADFQRFICSLPQGSVVRWVSSGFRFDHIPLQDSSVSIEQFTDSCRDCGVEFVYVFRY